MRNVRYCTAIFCMVINAQAGDVGFLAKLGCERVGLPYFTRTHRIEIIPHTSSAQSFFCLDAHASRLIDPLLNDTTKAVLSETALLPFFEFKRDNTTALLARMMKKGKVRNAEGIVIPTSGDKLKKKKEETKELYAAQKSARIRAGKLPISKKNPYRADKGKFVPIQQPRGKR